MIDFAFQVFGESFLDAPILPEMNNTIGFSFLFFFFEKLFFYILVVVCFFKPFFQILFVTHTLFCFLIFRYQMLAHLDKCTFKRK